MSPVVTCDKTGITQKMLKARIVAILTNRFLEWSILVSPLQAEWLTMMAGLNQGFSLSQEANHFTPVMSYEMKGNCEGSAKELAIPNGRIDPSFWKPPAKVSWR